MHRRIKGLEATAASAAAPAKVRIDQQLTTLRAYEAAARSIAHGDSEAFDERFEQFASRLRVAHSAVAAELAVTPRTFTDAVEVELCEWEAYFERLQAQAALRAESTRYRAEAAISELRRRRNSVAAQLTHARAARGGAWEEEKARLAALRDELQHKADELSATFT
jgi:seryl-tRNA synthetase